MRHFIQTTEIHTYQAILEIILVSTNSYLLNTDKKQLIIKLATYCIKAHDVRNQNIA